MVKIKYNYDTANDVLYISVGEPRLSYGDDLFDGITARYDMNTNEFTGVTILDFKARHTDNDPDLVRLSSLFKFSANIDFESALLA